MSSPKVTYFYDAEASSAYFSADHPMVPERVNMTHELVQNYNMFAHMEVVRYHSATSNDLRDIHLSDYIDYLQNISPSTVASVRMDEDCPVFPGMYDFTSRIVGSSLAAANKINDGTSDVCINWSGGMHHAKKRGPSGFCFTNDIVAAIVELLRHHKRVMYIDIDVHHGDGVQEFFYDTNRVMTISFHQYDGRFFPGSGGIEEAGVKEGANYAINVPLQRGIDDASYERVFNPVIECAMERYQPEALVLQMGADSVTGDPIGDFNLSSKGHSAAMEFALEFHLPTIILGGGGYRLYNVPRVWTYETSRVLGLELEEDIPENSYLRRLNKSSHTLLIRSSRKTNDNTKRDIQSIVNNVREIITRTEIAPSVPIKLVPSDWQTSSSPNDLYEELQPDIRLQEALLDTNRVNPLEYYQDDFDNDKYTSEWPIIPDSWYNVR